MELNSDTDYMRTTCFLPIASLRPLELKIYIIVITVIEKGPPVLPLHCILHCVPTDLTPNLLVCLIKRERLLMFISQSSQSLSQ